MNWVITWKLPFDEGDFSGVGNGHFFNCWVGFSPPPSNVIFGEGVGQSIHGGGNRQDGSRGNIFSKMENRGGIIQGDNSPGHCFVLRDSMPMKILK